MSHSILQVEGLTVSLLDRPDKRIVERVSFEVPPVSIVALVGGSGSGKTTTGLSVLRLLSPALKMEAGKISFKGEDLSTMDSQEMNAIRGKEIGMVFQDPLQAFNPVFTIGFQVSEVLKYHATMAHDGIRGKVLELFAQVGLDDPARVYKSYPHQLSGGMRQRAMIAQAVAAGPSLLIADEPTSSLDVTLQARILELFLQLRNQYKLSIVLITHDLGIVAHMADYVVVMEKGRVVESGKTKDVISHAKHAYTQQLMGTLND
jgi:ABC-type dipeptide/oligopeptide/nickel transport system ATPase component